jgi:hypothetical protein
MRSAIIHMLLLATFSACGIPSLVRSPLEFLGLFRFFNRSTQTTPTEFSIGGAVSGLFSGASITLTNDNESVTLTSDGNFTFPTKLKTGASYKVSFSTANAIGMVCTIANSSGTVQTADITNVSIICNWGTDYYEVGVSVANISASITVQNNGSDSRSFSSAGLYKFSTRIKTGSAYAVTISSQTAGSVCAFEDPTLTVGTMGTTNVTIFARCVTGFLSGGTIQTVAAATLVSSTVSSQNFYLRTMVGSYPGASAGSANNANPSLVTFNNPRGMASAGNFVYVADATNNLIRRIDQSNGSTTTLAGGNAGGGVTCPGATTTNCKDGTGLDAQFNMPFKLTTDGTNLYVLEFLGSRIRKINLATAAVTTLAGNGNFAFLDNANGILAAFNQPHDITLYNGTLYVADRINNRIRAVSPVTGAVTTFAGSGASGYADLNGTSAQLNNPIGIVGLDGFLYFTDIGNERIRRVALSGANAVTTVAGNGTSATIDGFGTSAQFGGPFSIATDGTDLFISDYNTYKIRHLRLSDSKVTTLIGGGGAAGYVDNAVSNSRMGQPVYLISDGSNLYISDEANHSIRRLENAELLRYTFDGNSLDSVGTNPVAFTNGSPTPTTDENGTTNGAYYFDGVSRFISTSLVTFSGQVKVQDLSVSAWVYPSGVGAVNQYIFYHGTIGVDGYGLVFNSTTRGLNVSINGLTLNGAITSKLPLNQWSHVTLTRLGVNWEIHINGVSQSIGFSLSPATPTSSFKVADAASGFKGKISDVRFFNGVLDQNAIRKLAVQVPSGLVAYYPFNDSNSDDQSGNFNHLMSSGTTFYSPDRFGIAGMSIEALGAGYFEKSSPNGLPTGNSDRSMCAWVRAANTSPRNVLSFGTLALSNGNGLAINSTGIIAFGYGGPGFDSGTTHNGMFFRWVHICATATYNGTNMLVSTYQNGLLRNTDDPVAWNTATTPNLRVGARMDLTELFYGGIDDVRIYNRVLSANEIRALSGPHPLQVADLQMHLQAETVGDSGFLPAIDKWVDNSPNNLAGTASDGNSVTDIGFNPSWDKNALNGKPAVIFSGAEVLGNVTGTYPGLTTSTFTAFIVNYRTDIMQEQALFTIGPYAGGKSFIYQDEGGIQCGNISFFSLYSEPGSCFALSDIGIGNPLLNEFQVFSLIYDESTSITIPIVRNNGGFSAIPSVVPNSFTPPSAGDGLFVGAANSFPDYPFKGGISEIIYYDRVLNTAESNAIRCYLSSKYDVPTGHACP